MMNKNLKKLLIALPLVGAMSLTSICSGTVQASSVKQPAVETNQKNIIVRPHKEYGTCTEKKFVRYSASGYVISEDINSSSVPSDATVYKYSDWRETNGGKSGMGDGTFFDTFERTVYYYYWVNN